MRSLFSPSFLSGFNIPLKLKLGSAKLIRSVRIHAEFLGIPNAPHLFYHIRKKNPDYIPREPGFSRAFTKDLTTTLDDILVNNRTLFAHPTINVSKPDFRDFCKFLLQNDVNVVLADKNMGFALVDNSLLRAAIDSKLMSNAFMRVDPAEGARLLLQEVRHFIVTLTADTNTRAARIPKDYLDIINAVLPDVDNKPPLPSTINPLAKVHKNSFNEKTWRIIVQAHRSPFQPFDAWFAKFMDPVLTLIPFHVRDSPTAIRSFEHLRFKHDDSVAFGKVDITDLYNNLDLDLVSRAIEFFVSDHFQRLSAAGVPTGPFSVGTIIRALRIANRSNFIEYGDSWFRQCKGIAMGRAAGVTIAVLTLAFVERDLKTSFFSDASWLLSRRYIDDIMFVKIDNSPSIGADVAAAYQNALGIPATVEAFVVSRNGDDNKSIDVLDFTVTRDGDRLVISPYDKPTNLHLFIPPRSNHPTHVGLGWIRAYLQRLARNSSTYEIFAQSAVDFFTYLRARGFRSTTLLSYFDNFSYSKERSKFWSKYEANQRDYASRIRPFHYPKTTSFYAPIPFNKGTGAIRWTKLLNSVRNRNMDDLMFGSMNYPKFRTAWTTLPSMATLVVRTLQAHFQGNINPNTNPNSQEPIAVDPHR